MTKLNYTKNSFAFVNFEKISLKYFIKFYFYNFLPFYEFTSSIYFLKLLPFFFRINLIIFFLLWHNTTKKMTMFLLLENKNAFSSIHCHLESSIIIHLYIFVSPFCLTKKPLPDTFSTHLFCSFAPLKCILSIFNLHYYLLAGKKTNIEWK